MITIDVSVIVMAFMLMPVILLGVCILAAIVDVSNLKHKVRAIEAQKCKKSKK